MSYFPLPRPSYLFRRIGLRAPYHEIGEKWYHLDYLWDHVAWVLGRREFTFFWQRRTQGFDESDLWNLDDTIVRFVLPRLKAFRNLRGGKGPAGWPSSDAMPTYESWLEALDKMIWSMEHWIEENGIPKDEVRWQEGMDLFHIYFHALWD